MSLSFSCPLCGKSFSVEENAAGSLLTCPGCMQQVLVSDLETKVFSSQKGGEGEKQREMVEASEVIGERYEIWEKLGQGGMGVVYRARHIHLEKWVAVKFLSPSLSREPQFRERFLREAKILAALDHPHIVRVLDMGVEERGCYYVMEYVDGSSLDQYVLQKKPSLEEIYRILWQVAQGLEYAHSKGVVHRDMKPANVLITQEGVAKIADFGLVRLLENSSICSIGKDSDLTTTGMVLGTYKYMAPEQRRGETVDEKADIYALGVMTYELLTGKEPVGRFRLPSEIVPEIPKELDEVLEKMLEPDQEERLSKVAFFREVLERLLEKKPLLSFSSATQKNSRGLLFSLALGSQIGCSVAVTFSLLFLILIPVFFQVNSRYLETRGVFKGEPVKVGKRDKKQMSSALLQKGEPSQKEAKDRKKQSQKEEKSVSSSSSSSLSPPSKSLFENLENRGKSEELLEKQEKDSLSRNASSSFGEPKKGSDFPRRRAGERKRAFLWMSPQALGEGIVAFVLFLQGKKEMWEKFQEKHPFLAELIEKSWKEQQKKDQ